MKRSEMIKFLNEELDAFVNLDKETRNYNLSPRQEWELEDG